MNEIIVWDTFNSFIGVNGEVRYQEGRTDCTVARVTVDGREVTSPSSDLDAVYRNFNSRYARHVEGIEGIEYGRRY